MEIIYKDEHVVVCNKPSGTLSEGESASAMPTLLGEALGALGEKNTRVFPVHRLDKETSGLMVFARSSKAAAALSESIADSRMKKVYLALLCGVPKEEKGRLEDLLFFDRQRSKSFVVDRDRKGVKRAILEYETVCASDDYTLVRVFLLTGRTHQIRAQFASRGLPLAGDRRYGAPKESAEGLALLSYKLSFPHPKTGALMEFELEDMGAAFHLFREKGGAKKLSTNIF